MSYCISLLDGKRQASELAFVFTTLFAHYRHLTIFYLYQDFDSN